MPSSALESQAGCHPSKNVPPFAGYRRFGAAVTSLPLLMLCLRVQVGRFQSSRFERWMRSTLRRLNRSASRLNWSRSLRAMLG